MAKSAITGTFATRREAEMAVETLVQEYDVDRKAVQVRAEGEENTSGTEVSGADAADRGRGDEQGDPILPQEQRAQAEGQRAGGIVVSAEVDDSLLERARAAFREYGAS